MWLQVIYLPTTLFSLKSSSATNSAGKSLISPSPYSVKMALLNAIITFGSLELITDSKEEKFQLIRDLEIRFGLPERIIVNNCFVKIQKAIRSDSQNKKDNPNLQFQSTVAFREYVYFDGELKIAINIKDMNAQDLEFLKKWLIRINYFGKKGCFFQFLGFNELENLSNEYSTLLTDGIGSGVMFPMDDVSKHKKVKFENMSNLSSRGAKREQQIHIFPFELKTANKNFTHFEKIKNL